MPPRLLWPRLPRLLARRSTRDLASSTPFASILSSRIPPAASRLYRSRLPGIPTRSVSEVWPNRPTPDRTVRPRYDTNPKRQRGSPPLTRSVSEVFNSLPLCRFRSVWHAAVLTARSMLPARRMTSPFEINGSRPKNRRLSSRPYRQRTYVCRLNNRNWGVFRPNHRLSATYV
jgi:hypothetical protein